MTHPSGTILRALLVGAVLGYAPVEELGVSGNVSAPDGRPVSNGSVVMQSQGGGRTTSSIDDAGRFRVIPNVPGVYQVAVSVEGFAPYRVSVDVPRSRTLKLPLIRLSPATYFRVRFVSDTGEPIISPQLRRRSFDANGPIRLPDDRVSEQIGSDSTITIGPLPRGITTLALDTPPLAQTRLPDLFVTGKDAVLDGGTVVVQPGAVLHVDVVDEGGAPVPQHDVFIEDVRPLSPMGLTSIAEDHRSETVLTLVREAHDRRD
jgi:Carboxypeptidase regulatory-like domain